MRHLGSILVASTLAACGAPTSDACGLKADVPDVASGTLTVTRDGSAYQSPSTGIKGYKLINNATDIEAGDITLKIGKDKDGNNVLDLVNNAKFPICIPLNDNSDGTTYADIRTSNGNALTDGSNTGTVAILAKDGDQLVGRFELRAKNTRDGSITELKDGQFKLGSR